MSTLEKTRTVDRIQTATQASDNSEKCQPELVPFIESTDLTEFHNWVALFYPVTTQKLTMDDVVTNRWVLEADQITDQQRAIYTELPSHCFV